MRMQINPPPCDRFWIGFHENPTFDIHAGTQSPPPVHAILIESIRMLIAPIFPLIETSIASDSILPNMVQMANSIMKAPFPPLCDSVHRGRGHH